MTQRQTRMGATLGDILATKPYVSQAFEDNGLAPLLSRKGVVFIMPSISNPKDWIENASADMLQAQVVEYRNGRPAGNLARIKLASRGQGADLMIQSRSGDFAKLIATRHPGILKGPELPTTGDAYKPATVGGDAITPQRLFADQTNAIGRPVAIALASRLAANFSYHMLKDCGRSNNCYMSTVAGLLKFLETTGYEQFDTIKNLVDYNAVTSFYIIVQPFRRTQPAPYLVDDETLTAWMASDMCNLAMADAKAYLLALGAPRPRVANKPRAGVLQLNTTDQMKTALKQAYLAMYKNRQEVAAAALAADEFRFFMAAYFDGLNKDFSQARFREILDFVQYCMPGNDLESESYLMRLSVDAAGSEAILRNALGLQLIRFVNSSASLYYSSEVGDAAEGSMTLDAAKVLTEFYNITYTSYKRLEAFAPEEVAGLSHECQQELKDYLKSNGLDSLRQYMPMEAAAPVAAPVAAPAAAPAAALMPI